MEKTNKENERTSRMPKERPHGFTYNKRDTYTAYEDKSVFQPGALVNLGATCYANAALQCMRKFRLEKTLTGHMDTCKKNGMNCHTICHALCISKFFTFSILLYYFSSTFHAKVCVMDAKETGITNYMNAILLV